MALTNYEKQKRWREKNRALYNLQQRNRRKKISGTGEAGTHGAVEAECRQDQPKTRNTSSPSLPFQTKKVGELNMIVMPKETVEEHSTMTVEKPKVFRNDYGAVISERAYNQLQEKKRKAKEGGYEIDEYSQ